MLQSRGNHGQASNSHPNICRYKSRGKGNKTAHATWKSSYMWDMPHHYHLSELPENTEDFAGASDSRGANARETKVKIKIIRLS